MTTKEVATPIADVAKAVISQTTIVNSVEKVTKAVANTVADVETTATTTSTVGVLNKQTLSSGTTAVAALNLEINKQTVESLGLVNKVAVTTSISESTTTTTTTPIVELCGSGTLELANGEQCDDGNDVDGDGCDSTCQL